jgi:hypothetical protein
VGVFASRAVFFSKLAALFCSQRIRRKSEDADLTTYAGNIITTVETQQQLANDTRKNLWPTSEGKSGVGKSESSGSPASSGATGNLVPGVELVGRVVFKRLASKPGADLDRKLWVQ